MPLIKTNQSVNAGITVTPWQGNQYEYLPWDARIDVAILGDAGTTFLGTVFSGSDVLMQNSAVDVLAVASPIVYPDHYSLTDLASAGERISAQVTNQGGVAAILRTAARLEPLG